MEPEKKANTYYDQIRQELDTQYTAEHHQDLDDTPPSFHSKQRKEENLPRENENADDPHHLRTLLSWHAPGRPYRERGREYYINIFLICLFLEVILLLFREYLLMAVLASLVFLAYVLSSVPPRALFYKISTEGIMVEDHFYIWEELYDFYFKHVDGHDVLHIRTKWMLPGELILVLTDIPKEHVRDILLKYLPFREYVKPTFTEKSADWLSNTFPLERR